MMRIIFLITIFLLFSGRVEAAFQYMEVGARPIGMNGAFSAIVDDANSIVYNVAGLGRLNRSEFMTMYAALNPGMGDVLGLGSVAYVQPLSKWGTIAISRIEFSSNLYREQVWGISYGYQLKYFTKVCVGLSLKYMGKGYVSNLYTRIDPTFAEKMDTGGIGIDMGLLLPEAILPGLSVSVVGKNINQPDIRLKKRDIVPAEYRAGVGYKIKNLTLDMDVLWRTNIGNDQNIFLGGEMWLFNNVGFRAGLGVGNNEYFNISTGLSWQFTLAKIVNSTVDYGFVYNPTGIIGTGKHQVSLSFKF